MDNGREVSFDLKKFRHLDYGYAVTSHSSQGLTVDRVLINADTRESVRLLNDRMAYVAISRARDDARIYTDSTQNLSEALNRGIDKTTAVEVLQENERDLQKALTRNEISRLVAHSFALADPAMLRQANSHQEQPPSIVEQSSKVNETILTELLAKNDPTLQDINALSLAQRDQNISSATPHSHSDPVPSTSTPPPPSSQEPDHDIDLLH
jgi:prophage DNA circulation protein